jgi:hypothetical protein
VTGNIHNCILNWKYSSNSIQNIIEISRFTKLIYRLLFRIFIENKVNLLSFEVILVKYDEIESIEYSFELILQNPNFICNIKILKFDFDISSEFITKFLLFFNSNCKSISSLYFLFPSSFDDYPIIEKSLSQIINSQENLKKILFGLNKGPLYHSLLSLNNSNCSNSLNTIIFYCINFRKIITIIQEVF